MYGYCQKQGEYLHISCEISIIEFSMNVPSKYTQEFSFTPVFINSQTCLFFILPFFGVITKWKDAGEVLMTGVNLNSFVLFDGSFILCCKRDIVNSKLF